MGCFVMLENGLYGAGLQAVRGAKIVVQKKEPLLEAPTPGSDEQEAVFGVIWIYEIFP